jgi:type II secretory pathway pseudopilin PulG
MPVRRLLAALATIAFLAIAAPYAAITSFHARRLRAADADLRAIASTLRAEAGRGARLAPPGVQLLVGPGQRPRADDPRWNVAVSVPFGLAGGPDPWGNAYLVTIPMGPSGAAWAVSAGPDGIVQTPFGAGDTVLKNDDRVLRIR